MQPWYASVLNPAFAAVVGGVLGWRWDRRRTSVPRSRTGVAEGRKPGRLPSRSDREPEAHPTRRQIPRGAFADAETGERIVLIKNVSVLRPTYQVRMLAYRALSTGRELVICLPAHGEAHESLRGLMREHPGTILLHKGEG